MIYQAIYDSPLGDISVQSDGENVTALYFVGQRYDGTMEEGSFESLESLPYDRNQLEKLLPWYATDNHHQKNDSKQ